MIEKITKQEMENKHLIEMILILFDKVQELIDVVNKLHNKHIEIQGKELYIHNNDYFTNQAKIILDKKPETYNPNSIPFKNIEK